jgi:glycosyltransferase involved in cell wall biosynthesis
VDDGSSDGTAGLLAAWAGRDPRVRVLPAAHAPGSAPGLRASAGVAAALRRAAAAARAPLLARMDADDVALPPRLQRQADFLAERPDLAACGTRVELFPSSRVGIGYRRYQAWLNGLAGPASLRRDLFVECPIAHPTLMIRAPALRALGGYRDEGWPEDYDLLLRLHRAGLRADVVPETLLRWRVRPGRLSRVSAAYSPEAFRRCKAHFLVRGELPEGRVFLMWGAGRVGKPLAVELARQGRAPRAFIDVDPRKLGQEIHGLPVIPPAELGRWPGAYVLVAVGAPGAREEIRAELTATGREELRDYRVAA